MIVHRTRSAAVIVAALTVLAGVTVVPAQATGVPALVSCPLSETSVEHSPGKLLFRSRLITTAVTAQYTCVAVEHGLQQTSRTGSSTVSIPPSQLSCVTALQTPPAVQTINWSTGGFSTLTGTTTITTVVNTVVVTDTGTVTAGDFQGRRYENIVLYTNLAFDQLLTCLAEPGLTRLDGTATLTIF